MSCIFRRLWYSCWIVIGNIPVGKVHTMHIINKSIIVVIYPIAWSFILIRPYICTKILMPPFAPSVHYRDHHLRGTARAFHNIPGLRKLHCPQFCLVAESRIIWINALPSDRPPNTINRYLLGVDDAWGKGKVLGNSFRNHVGTVAHIVRSTQRHQIALGLWSQLYMIQKWIHALNGVHFVSSRLTIKNVQTSRDGFAWKINPGIELNYYDMRHYIWNVLSQYSTGAEE